MYFTLLVILFTLFLQSFKVNVSDFFFSIFFLPVLCTLSECKRHIIPQNDMVYISEVSIIITLAVRSHQSSDSDRNERCNKLEKYADLLSSSNTAITFDANKL